MGEPWAQSGNGMSGPGGPALGGPASVASGHTEEAKQGTWNGCARSPWLSGPRVYSASRLLSLLPWPHPFSGCLHHPRHRPATCPHLFGHPLPSPRPELPREGEVSGQRSLAEPVKVPFSLGPLGCWLTGLTADGGSWLPVLVAGCGPGSWAEMEMVTLWQGLSEVGCPQKQSLRQGLGAGGYLREDLMEQEEGNGGLLQSTSKGIVPRRGGGLRALERAVSSPVPL